MDIFTVILTRQAKRDLLTHLTQIPVPCRASESWHPETASHYAEKSLGTSFRWYDGENDRVR